MWYIGGIVCSVIIMSATIIYVQFQNNPVLYQNLIEYFLGAESGWVLGDQHVHFPNDLNYASYILTFTDIFHFH